MNEAIETKEPVVSVGSAENENGHDVDRWTLLALVYGFNELTKMAENLRSKLYFRVLRDDAEREFVERGGKAFLQHEPPALVLDAGVGMPSIRLREADIEAMRACVAEHDRKVLELPVVDASFP
jgi:hypothetical protein